MHIKKTKHTFADGSKKTQITLVESYRPGKGMNPVTRTIQDYGYLEDQTDPEAFLDTLQKMVADHRKANEKISLTIDVDKPINDPTNRDLRFGPYIVKQIYDQLRIPEFIQQNRKSKARYDLNEILCFLTCMKLVFPDSKRSTYMDIQHIFGTEKTFDLQDVYHALGEICDLRVALQKHL